MGFQYIISNQAY